MATLTADEAQAISARLAAHYDLSRGSRFQEAPASRDQKDHLRYLLVAHADTHPEEVRLIRGLFNDVVAEGATVLGVEVENAIRLLRAL